MRFFAIGDLHLSDGEKPMDVFGDHWQDHFSHIREAWLDRVDDADAVLLPGDFSWAMRLEDAQRHLALLNDLPGKKVLLRGNHDYWWSSVSRVRDALGEGCYALQNDAMALGGALLCGSRGWVLPGEGTKDDERLYAREVIRLRMSLEAARRISETMPLIVMTHFPPLSVKNTDTEFARLIAEYDARYAVYGHLHGASLRQAFQGKQNGTEYVNVSADGIGFAPRFVCEI